MRRGLLKRAIRHMRYCHETKQWGRLNELKRAFRIEWPKRSKAYV